MIFNDVLMIYMLSFYLNDRAQLCVCARRTAVWSQRVRRAPARRLPQCTSRLGLLPLLRGRGLLRGGHLLRQYLLHTLLLLDQERADHPHAGASRAPRAAIGTIHTPLALLQPPVLDGPQARHADDGLAAVAALRAFRLLLHQLVHELSSRSAKDALLVPG